MYIEKTPHIRFTSLIHLQLGLKTDSHNKKKTIIFNHPEWNKRHMQYMSLISEFFGFVFFSNTFYHALLDQSKDKSRFRSIVIVTCHFTQSAYLTQKKKLKQFTQLTMNLNSNLHIQHLNL